MADLNGLNTELSELLSGQLLESSIKLNELTVVVSEENLVATLYKLRDQAGFEQLIDLCGMDYSTYADECWEGARFAVVYHLLSVSRNCRLRVKVFIQDEDYPLIPSACEVWPCSNWFEREAFDLYGIVFRGHPDLRRILTDYGFVGHPFRKDFPLSGHVEMHYDEEQQRVVYRPVTVEPREVTPRIVREENFAS